MSDEDDRRHSDLESGWRVRSRTVPLDRPLVLGIVNVTPDSFSDGGKFFSSDAALAHSERLLDEGADVLEVGGESTRPQGAVPVPASEEAARVLPVIRSLRARHPGAILSIDTVKAEVARRALDEGVDIVNDVSGFRLDPELAAVSAATGAGVILMHSRGTVSDMATYTHAEYGADPTGEVIGELRRSVQRAADAGVSRDAIVLDPGIGFSKRSEHSLTLLAQLPRLVEVGFPVLVGVSRKRVIGELTGESRPDERVAGSVGANVAGLALGARLFRVHDVRANRQALDVAWAILRHPRAD